MERPERYTISVITAAGGGATAYFPAAQGRVLRIAYTKVDFADGVDFAITTDKTGQNVWTENNVNASKAICPRQPTHDPAGAASLYAAAGEPVECHIWVAGERIKVVVTAGGASKSGTFEAIIG